MIRFNKDIIQKFKRDTDFDYVEDGVKSTEWTAFKEWIMQILQHLFEGLFGDENAEDFLDGFLAFLPYLMIGILIYLVAWFLLKRNVSGMFLSQKNKNNMYLSEEEQIIKNENIDQLITNAVNEQKYRIAVRYYYLKTLKLLSEKQLIAWDFPKTNEDYLAELSSSTFVDLFKDLTHLYDYIWYGDFPIDANGFHKSEHKFKQLHLAITQHGA